MPVIIGLRLWLRGHRRLSVKRMESEIVMTHGSRTTPALLPVSSALVILVLITAACAIVTVNIFGPAHPTQFGAWCAHWQSAGEWGACGARSFPGTMTAGLW